MSHSLRSSLFCFLSGKQESRKGTGIEVTKKLVAGGGAAKERKSLLLSPDILPYAPNYFCSLGPSTVTSTVTRDPIILTSGKIRTAKILVLKSAG